jgi:hypothetical protein
MYSEHLPSRLLARWHSGSGWNSVGGLAHHCPAKLRKAKENVSGEVAPAASRPAGGSSGVHPRWPGDAIVGLCEPHHTLCAEESW